MQRIGRWRGGRVATWLQGGSGGDGLHRRCAGVQIRADDRKKPRAPSFLMGFMPMVTGRSVPSHSGGRKPRPEPED